MIEVMAELGLGEEIRDVPGVIDTAVSYERKLAELRVREERAPNPNLLVKAIVKAGYVAEAGKT
jgi:hypothetical protein